MSTANIIIQTKLLCPCDGGCPRCRGIQPKLKTGKPDDKYEQEADRVADQVMKMPDPEKVQQNAGCSSCIDTKEEEPVERKALHNIAPLVVPGLLSRIHSQKGSGRPLPGSVRSYFEPRFGRSFGDVRMHTDANAADTAKSIGAKAFTRGKDVVFGAGQYSPETGEGRRLLGHELVHVVQQGNTNEQIQCQRRLVNRQEDSSRNIRKLNRLLNRFNVPEKAVIRLLNRLNPAEKQIVIRGYKKRIARAFNIQEMVQAVRALDPPLVTKLRWVDAAAIFTRSIDYADIKRFITARGVTQHEKNRLKTRTWRNFFVKVCTNKTMLEALKDLNFDLFTKLHWILAEVTVIRTELNYPDIKKWITDAHPGERKGLNNSYWRGVFVKICTNKTMVQAVNDIGFTLFTKLDWMLKEGTTASDVYSVIRMATPQELPYVENNRHMMARLKKDLSTSALKKIYRLLNRVAYADIKGSPLSQPSIPHFSRHPVLEFGKQGNNPDAVRELQQKLNSAKERIPGLNYPALTVNGNFDRTVRDAVIIFKRTGQPVIPIINLTHERQNCMVAHATWKKLDRYGRSTIGRAVWHYQIEAGGFLASPTARYTWRILRNRIRVTVKIRFDADSRISNRVRLNKIRYALRSIRHFWNRYRAIHRRSNTIYDIEFIPRSVARGQDFTVRLLPGRGRFTARRWYIHDPSFGIAAAHEFGHFLGLVDEYQQSAAAYTRITGRNPPSGPAITSRMRSRVRRITGLMHWALYSRASLRLRRAIKVIKDHNLKQGQYAQLIARTYRSWYHRSIIDDIISRIQTNIGNIDYFNTVNPFTYTVEESLMGGEKKKIKPLVKMRHIREFVRLLKKARPGRWEVYERE